MGRTDFKIANRWGLSNLDCSRYANHKKLDTSFLNNYNLANPIGS